MLNCLLNNVSVRLINSSTVFNYSIFPNLCMFQECNDVMNYMLQYFLNLASNDPYRCAEMLFGNLNGEVVDMEVTENET